MRAAGTGRTEGMPIRSRDSKSDVRPWVCRQRCQPAGGETHHCVGDSDTKSEFASGLLNTTLASHTADQHQKVDKDAAEWLPDLNQH